VTARARRRAEVVGLGYNTIDHLCVVARHVRLDSKQRMVQFDRQPGGQVPTALVALQRWGLATRYVGSFGDDAGGREARASLVAEGVDVASTVVRAGLANQESVILVDQASGERSVLWQRPEGIGLRPDELSRRDFTDCRLLLTDGYDIEAATAAAGWARAAGALVMLDIDFPGPGVDRLLALTDLLIVSPDFLLRLTGIDDLRKALRASHRLGPRVCVATMGTGGALALENGRVLYQPAYRVDVRDSTGAGDVFHAGYAYGVLRGWPTVETLRFAAAAAALKCEKLGPRPGIPAVERAMELAGVAART
jgi:sugar/nucleoside kinase (ribokinase family)